MDIGECLTNVISIHELTSITYAYLEASTTSPSSLLALRRLTARWQKDGHIVTLDKSGHGLWLFKNCASEKSGLSSPWSCMPPAGQLLKEKDVDLDVKHIATYDFSGLIEFWQANRKVQQGNTSKDATQKFFSSAQNAVQNHQALAANSTINLLDQTAGKRIGEKPADSPSFFSIGRAHEHFFIALMSSMSVLLCKNKGYVPLGARTLVAPKHDGMSNEAGIVGVANASSQIHLLTLDADYTGGKVLVIKATVSEAQDLTPSLIRPSHLTLPGTPSQGSILILAPGGIFGRYIRTISPPEAYDAGRLDRVSSVNAVKPTVSSWMSQSLDWFETKGFSSEQLKAEPWLLVELDFRDILDGLADSRHTDPSQANIVPWPSRLCFQRQSRLSRERLDPMPRMDATSFAEFAQSWLMAEDERAQLSHTRKQEREALEAAKRSQAQVENDLQDVSHMTSPLALRRSSLAGMVYPTPPDAVQVGIGATPTFDGSMSTPGPQLSHQMEAMDQSTIKRDGDGTDQMEGFSQQGAGGGFSDNNNNLFEDMDDDDLFGIDNGVTDADFSFFDQPDSVEPMDTDNASGDHTEPQQQVGMLDEGLLRPGLSSMLDNHALAHPDIAMANTETTNMDDRASGLNDTMLPAISIRGGHTVPEDSPPTRDTSPPLKPDAVFRRLSTTDSAPRTGAEKDEEELSQPSSSNPFVDLGPTPSMSTFQQKYGPNGRFVYPTKPILPISIRAGIPTTDYFKRRRQRKLTARANGSALPSLTKKQHEEQGGGSPIMLESASALHRTPPPLSDDDDSSDDKDMADSLAINGKRKREVDDDGHIGLEEDLMTATLNDSSVGQDAVSSEDETTASFELASIDGDPAGWSLARYLAWPDSWTIAPILKDTDFAAAARVLSDQAMSCNFEYPCRDSSVVLGVDSQNGQHALHGLRNSQQDVVDTTQQIFKEGDPCTLANFLNIRGTTKPPPFGRLLPRPAQHATNNHAPNSSQNTIFEINPPHLEVRRSESKLAVLPAAIDFWDVLGLAPRSNAKDITALCLYAIGSATMDEAELFMENMRSAYESRRFGCHERLPGAAEGVSNGIMALDLDQAARFSYDRGLSFVSEKLTEVLKAITTAEQSDRNFVLYFVYEPKDYSAVVCICGAFELILQRYSLATLGRGSANELVLQLVPRSLVGSRTNLVVPSPSQFGKLAHEVYGRCYNFEIGWPSPSISIEPPLPRGVEFKPAPTPSASLLQENSCLHIAYAQSIDDRWISVAWTDNTGNDQFTESYCLGRKGDPLSRQFQEVAHEIWEATMDIILAKKVHWRLMIVKCGPIEPDDTAFWRDLASTETRGTVTLTVLTVDTAPSLQLIPSEIELPAAGMATQSGFASTPTASTPQGSSVLSPDSGVPSTPAESAADIKIDPDATLLELSDQTYGAVCQHELNDRKSLLDNRPTLISGYLIKRAEHTRRVMEVNIIYTDANRNLHDRQFREVLGWYGNLSTLARARGVVDPAGDPRPWHVVMAERICKAMYILM